MKKTITAKNGDIVTIDGKTITKIPKVKRDKPIIPRKILLATDGSKAEAILDFIKEARDAGALTIPDMAAFQSFFKGNARKYIEITRETQELP